MNPILNYNGVVLRLPTNSRTDNYLFWAVVPLMAVMLNVALFGQRFWTSLTVLMVGGITVFIMLAILWFMLNHVAALMRIHFANYKSPLARILTTIVLYIIITALFITIVHWVFDSTSFLGYRFIENRYTWTLFSGIVLNIFITLLHEGIAAFTNWKATMIETEQLKKEYMKSQLLGLKSQVNPHFLFNSLNSLSSLISENQEEAEKFLDEMSKVYRYLLRNSDDHLVTLGTELQFVKSYFYLLKARYSEGIEMSFDIREEDLHRQLPPLTLQMLVEAAYNQNTVSKDKPLVIEIQSVSNGWLRIRNNVEKKLVLDDSDQAALENVANKFRLLCQQNIVINKTGRYNVIELPLIAGVEKKTV